MEFLEKIILPEIFNFPNTIEQLTTKSSDNQHILHTVFFFSIKMLGKNICQNKKSFLLKTWHSLVWKDILQHLHRKFRQLPNRFNTVAN